ncbi:unnamed protein product [Phaedon cochleariae]|uniref:Fibronectin type III domain-containing protein n=1 Tax=Phaedon cochleariae TaxID=80249 RepID=A0A9N9X2T5_PHACE|nr:unnamed protein product [Phaedon cochleariae]
MEVEVREEASAERASSRYPITLLGNNTPGYPVQDVQVVVVRVEEILLVALVLVIWVAAIALFFNRWGKIRMLEPYQPKFCQQPHRPSCPLAPLSPPGVSSQVRGEPPAQSSQTGKPAALRNQKSIARMSFSKYNVNALTDPLSVLPSPIIRRQRQNSVFVGSTCIAMLNPPPRRSKSAVDIQHLVVNEHSPTASLSGSIIPILNKERRTSLITIERPYYSRHRPSITVDRPYIHHHRSRRLSCFADRVQHRHKNFMSFEQSFDRKTPPTIEETPSTSYETPLEAVEAGASVEAGPSVSTGAKPKVSRSFEQPSDQRRSRPERMATSLDVSSLVFDRRCSIPEEDRASPVSINLEECKVTAPLLEGLESSDV